MVTLLLVLMVGILLGAAGHELARRGAVRDRSPMLDDLRRTLAEMERDYRLRVATAELERETRA